MAKTEKYFDINDVINDGSFYFVAEQFVGIPQSRKEKNNINVMLNYDPETTRAIVYRSYTSGNPNPSDNGVPEYSVFYSSKKINADIYNISAVSKEFTYDKNLIAKDKWVLSLLYNDGRNFQLGGTLTHGTREDYWSNFRLEGAQPLDGYYNHLFPTSPEAVLLKNSTAKFEAFATCSEEELDGTDPIEYRLEAWRPINCIISEDQEGIYTYLSGGPLPEDVEVVGPDGQISEEPDGDEDENTDDTFENTPAVTPTSIKGASNYYSLSASNVETFINWLWYGMLEGSDLILNSATKIYNNMANNIESIRLYPLKTNKEGGTSPIVLGKFTSELQVPSVKDNFKFTHSSFTLNGKLKNADEFYGYEPYATCQIYLPFVGFKPLPLDIWGPKIVKNELTYPKITVKYGIDFRSGMGVCELWRNKDGKNALIDQYDCQIAIDIPFSTETGFNIVGDIVGTFTDVLPGSSTMKSMLGNKVNEALDMSNIDVSSSKSAGSHNSCSYLFNPFDVYILNTYSSVEIKGMDKFKHAFGRISMTGFKLSDLRGDGFTVCENVDIHFGNTTVEDVKVAPTQNEWEELKNLLESGVYL